MKPLSHHRNRTLVGTHLSTQNSKVTIGKGSGNLHLSGSHYKPGIFMNKKNQKRKKDKANIPVIKKLKPITRTDGPWGLMNLSSEPFWLTEGTKTPQAPQPQPHALSYPFTVRRAVVAAAADRSRTVPQPQTSREELITLQVEISPNISWRITMKEKDDPLTAVKQFARGCHLTIDDDANVVLAEKVRLIYRS